MAYVLDTARLLHGLERPPGECCATPEAVAEIRPGGKDHRRLMAWLEAGLAVQEATPSALATVKSKAKEAGSLPRLSKADLSLLALALQLGATLWTTDKTMLDVATRLAIKTEGGTIDGLIDWRFRCTGCGRWCDDATDCPVCGSPVRSRPTKRASL